MCQQALHCKCDMGKHTGLKEYQDLWNQCVANITQNKQGSNNIFHLFLVSFTIGGLGTNFFLLLGTNTKWCQKYGSATTQFRNKSLVNKPCHIR